MIREIPTPLCAVEAPVSPLSIVEMERGWG
jgi:hypothetical protein